MVVCLEQGADLHMAQVMPLQLTVSCFTKIQIDFTFLVPAYLGSPGKRAVKRVCVCVYHFYADINMPRHQLNDESQAAGTWLQWSTVIADSSLQSSNRRACIQIAATTLSGNSLRQTVHTVCASVHQAEKSVAAILRVPGVTAGLAESNGSLRRVYDSHHLQADCQELGSAPEPYAR